MRRLTLYGLPIRKRNSSTICRSRREALQIRFRSEYNFGAHLFQLRNDGLAELWIEAIAEQKVVAVDEGDVAALLWMLR